MAHWRTPLKIEWAPYWRGEGRTEVTLSGSPRPKEGKGILIYKDYYCVYWSILVKLSIMVLCAPNFTLGCVALAEQVFYDRAERLVPFLIFIYFVFFLFRKRGLRLF